MTLQELTEHTCARSSYKDFKLLNSGLARYLIPHGWNESKSTQHVVVHFKSQGVAIKDDLAFLFNGTEGTLSFHLLSGRSFGLLGVLID